MKKKQNISIMSGYGNSDMARMQVEGLEEYTKAIEKLSKRSHVIIKKSVYRGAGIIGDAVKEEIKKLPIVNGFGTKDEKINGVTRLQKADLIDGFGISPIKEDGEYINAKVGWSGYGRTKTKKYRKGVPNQLVARSVNSGTSFRQKNAFVDRAVRKNRTDAQNEMANVIDEEIEKEMK